MHNKSSMLSLVHCGRLSFLSPAHARRYTHTHTHHSHAKPQVGELSGVVETASGCHLILRRQ